MQQQQSVEVLPLVGVDTARVTREERLAQLEARRIGRSLIVPTDDGEVRMGLRLRGLPVCYFGEDAHDRRERLRAEMAQEHIRGESVHLQGSDVKSEEENESKEEQIEEEFYTEGTSELKQLRTELAKPSLKRSFARLQHERSLKDMKKSENEEVIRKREMEMELMDAVRSSYMISSQVGDDRPLSSIAYGINNGNELVATGSWGGNVVVWQGEESKKVQTLETHTARISTVNIPHQQPNVLLTSSADNTAIIYKISESSELYEMKTKLTEHDSRVTDIKMHPFRHSLITTSSFDGTFVLHDDGKMVLRQETGHEQVYRIAFHPEGGLMATCGLERGIRLWDLRSGRAVMTMKKAHAKDVLGVEFSGEGRFLASCGGDNVVRIWDIRKRACAKTIAAHRSLISGLRFGGGVNGSDVLYTCSFDKTIKCWSAKRNWGLVAAHTSHKDKVTAIDCSVDGKTLVSSCYDKTWARWGAEGS